MIAVRLGAIARVFNGNSINAADKEKLYRNVKGVPYIGTAEVGFDTAINYESGIAIPPERQTTFKRVKAGTPLVCAEGGSAGRKVGVVDRDVYFGNKLFAIEPTDGWCGKFIFYFCLSDSFREQFRAMTTGLIGGVSIKKFKEIEIPYFPIVEQRRIVAALDEIFVDISIARAGSERNLANAREIFETRLSSLFGLPGDGWVERQLKQVCEKITDGTHQTPKYFDDGVVFLSSRNVTTGCIDWENVRYIDHEQHLAMHRRVAPRRDDILLAKNGTTGVAALVDRDTVFDIYVSLAILRALPMIRPRLLLYFINSPVAKAQFNRRLKGMGVPNLHLEEIREVRLSFPESLVEQDRLVRELDLLQSETERLEGVFRAKLSALSSLKQSILSRAFAGELTTTLRDSVAA